MIFGRPEIFAIEIVSERTADTPKGIWGRSCVYVAGVAIGDISEPHCGLDHFADVIAELSDGLEFLSAPEFAVLEDIDVFAFLDQRLFQDIGQTEEEMRSDSDLFARFSFLTNVGEQFDGWKSFIFTRPDGSLRIVSKHEDSAPHVFSIAAGDFVSVASAFCKWIETERKNAQPGATAQRL